MKTPAFPFFKFKKSRENTRPMAPLQTFILPWNLQHRPSGNSLGVFFDVRLEAILVQDSRVALSQLLDPGANDAHAGVVSALRDHFGEVRRHVRDVLHEHLGDKLPRVALVIEQQHPVVLAHVVLSFHGSLQRRGGTPPLLPLHLGRVERVRDTPARLPAPLRRVEAVRDLHPHTGRRLHPQTGRPGDDACPAESEGGHSLAHAAAERGRGKLRHSRGRAVGVPCRGNGKR
mmetsp:Transcript_23518/g.56138  ORF Transcript_23518/g.56138 Transcript_23518/m.56138 type:complete len:231 (-) Transcript_23518:77-769(-)